MAEVVVKNLLPRILSFRGKLRLTPGEHIVDVALLDEAWRTDSVFRSVYEDRGVEVAGWKPDGAKQRATTSPSLTAGAPRVVRPADPRQSDRAAAEKAPKPPPAEVAVPQRQGGGVPGNVTEAAVLIGSTTDEARLRAWSAAETRATVAKALDKRLADLSAGRSEDGPRAA